MIGKPGWDVLGVNDGFKRTDERPIRGRIRVISVFRGPYPLNMRKGGGWCCARAKRHVEASASH